MGVKDFAVTGFDAGGIAGGIKKDGAPDLALIASQVPCRAAAVFTRNKFPAAPVQYDRRLLSFNPENIYGVVINSGNANACTGALGDANCKLMAEATERCLGAHDNTVFVMSTGVIGVQLPIERIVDAIPNAVTALQAEGWQAASTAIMTTDTRPKLFTQTAQIGDATVTLTGIAKGAGMIHPDMATMLSTIVTDVFIAQPLLQQALNAAVAQSFNRISIDGDTSTNDTVLVLANGMAGNEEITQAASPEYRSFCAALTQLSIELAQSVVRDGEGATKFVEVTVHGAQSDEDAHRAANTIATSPLVKTAFFGADANWGRFVMALGRSGAHVVPEQCDIAVRGSDTAGASMTPLLLLDHGTPCDYREEDAAARFALPEIGVDINLNLGEGRATVWTTDLSYEYVKINGDYRT